jgi:hypothetical protein
MLPGWRGMPGRGRRRLRFKALREHRQDCQCSQVSARCCSLKSVAAKWSPLSGALGREQIGVEFDDSVVSGVREFEEER